MHISDVSSFMPTPDPAIIFIRSVWTGLLKEIFSKEAIVWLPDSEYKRALMALPEFVLSRIY